MSNRRIPRPDCIECQRELPHGRKPPYCSKKCEALHFGYSKSYEQNLAQIAVDCSASTAWRPEPIEPITEIISAKPIAIFSDIHAPLHSSAWIMQGIEAALHFGCEDLIVSGDFIDANQISKHIGGFYRRKSQLSDDFAAGEKLVDLFSGIFKRVFFLGGNHDHDRLTKVFGGEMTIQRIWKMFGDRPNVKVTARSFVEVNRDVVVGHPRQYSRVRGSLPQKIAQMWQKHIALGHSHHSAKTMSPDGRWQAVDLPCMAQLNEFEYTTFQINDMPPPQNGFTIIFGTRMVVFDKFTPWEIYGLEPFQEK